MYNHLKNCNKILISGCGGGYDIFCGLDLMFNLLEQKKQVILGSYSFTENKYLLKYGKRVTKYCYEITHDILFDEQKYIDEMIQNIKIPPKSVLENMGMTRDEYIQVQLNKNSATPKIYFPEYKLVKHLHDTYNLNIPIYCFIDNSIVDLIEAYKIIVNNESIDCIILMDGGTDSLMTGIEKSLGTPYEDVSSIIAVNEIPIEKKFLYCLGYNVDKYHGVADEDFLKNTSKLIKDNYFIGSYSINKKDTSTQKYNDTFMKCDPENSIVNSAIIMSVNGHYGNVCPEWLKHRLEHNESKSLCEITPFMSFYWMYELSGVCKHLKYDVDKMKTTRDAYEILQLLKL
jgi:hypothetical protein